MAARLAILGILCFLHPFQEDLIVDWPSSFAPRSLEVAFGTLALSCPTHPTAPEDTVPPHLFRVLLLERLVLQFQARCNRCHEPLDPQGRHLAACPRTGRLKKHASPTERMLARICREAGARARYNAFLKDAGVHVVANDERRIEVLAQD